MAKKNRNNGNGNRTDWWPIVKMCAYIAMAVAAVAAILSFIFGLLSYCGVRIDWAGRVTGICNTIAQIALIIAVVIPAYHYAVGSKNAVVKAFFWVAVIFLVLGLVGINLAF